MARRFGLSRLRQGVSNRYEQLAHTNEADVRSYDEKDENDDGPMKPFTFKQADYDRTEPPKDEMRQYWRQFETTPIIRKPITSFASQVTEPGYYLQARDMDEEILKELDHWLQRAAIIEGEPGKDFRLLAKKVTVQREVRGTAMIEKAPHRDDPDQVAGLKLINPETMEAVTRPGQSILLEPDDIDEFEDAPEADSGGAAAYLQDLSETETFFGTPVRRRRGRDRGITDDDNADEVFKIGFRRDEIIKLTRDADVGEIFGTSRIEAIAPRVDGIKQKLDDNDEAIASKAYPLWLFMFGDPDSEIGVWESDDIDEFMRAHEMENFYPGQKQGVRGDVSVETISGEVAEIAEYLEFDIDWIMSAMPMPKFALGAFDTGAIGQVGGIAQQQDVNRQIKEARRELENEFTPLLREIAQQKGASEEEADNLFLKIGSPGEPEPEVPSRENVIRYVPKDQREPGQPQDGQQTADDGQVTGGDGIDGGGQQNPLQPPGTESEDDAPEEAGALVWHTSSNFEQLQMNSDDEQSQLSDLLYETMRTVRDQSLDDVGTQYGDAPTFAVSNFEQTANRVLRTQMSRGRFRTDIEPIVEEAIDDVEEAIGANTGRFSRNQNVRFYVQDIENSTEDMLEEMLRLMRIQARRSVVNNEDWANVEKRVREKYNDANLRQRAELIAHMELKNAVETTKLQQWESDPDVIGVRVVNENPSTPLTESLNGVSVMFDSGDVQDQLMDHTRSEFLQNGFNPLPPTPPFHFNDTTTLEPIHDD